MYFCVLSLALIRPLKGRFMYWVDLRYVAANSYRLRRLFFLPENFKNFQCYFAGEEELQFPLYSVFNVQMQVCRRKTEEVYCIHSKWEHRSYHANVQPLGKLEYRVCKAIVSHIGWNATQHKQAQTGGNQTEHHRAVRRQCQPLSLCSNLSRYSLSMYV